MWAFQREPCHCFMETVVPCKVSITKTDHQPPSPMAIICSLTSRTLSPPSYSIKKSAWGTKSGTPYCINHQTSPTASFHHGHLKRQEQPRLQAIAEQKVHDEEQRSLGGVIIMFGSILCHFRWTGMNLKDVLDVQLYIWQYWTQKLVYLVQCQTTADFWSAESIQWLWT